MESTKLSLDYFLMFILAIYRSGLFPIEKVGMPKMTVYSAILPFSRFSFLELLLGAS
jgi:hypothetical protein